MFVRNLIAASAFVMASVSAQAALFGPFTNLGVVGTEAVSFGGFSRFEEEPLAFEISYEFSLAAASGLSGFIGQLAITEAFAKGDASSVAPFEYTALAWAVGLDWLLWQTLPDGWTLVGAAIIIGSGMYLIRHEKVHVESDHP